MAGLFTALSSFIIILLSSSRMTIISADKLRYNGVQGMSVVVDSFEQQDFWNDANETDSSASEKNPKNNTTDFDLTLEDLNNATNIVLLDTSEVTGSFEQGRDEHGAEQHSLKISEDTNKATTQRRHHLRRRRDQSICQGWCRSQVDCRNQAASYFLCAGYVHCVYGTCSNVDPTPNNNRGVVVVAGVNPTCGRQCFSNANCRSPTDGCDTCVNGVCRVSGKCGIPCFGNPAICNGATDGCNQCVSGACSTPVRNALTCGSPCFDGNDCYNAFGGCTACVAGVCTAPPVAPVVVVGGVRQQTTAACINNEQSLEAALNIGGNIALCGGATILVTQEIYVSRDNINLTCLSAPCVLEAITRNRILRINGRNISISGITFRNGFANGDGGALYITGGDNLIVDCNFYGNRATRRGGAAMVYGGTYSGNDINGNFAPQCVQIYQQVTSSCVTQ